MVARRDDLEIFDRAFRAWFEQAPTRNLGQRPPDLGLGIDEKKKPEVLRRARPGAVAARRGGRGRGDDGGRRVGLEPRRDPAPARLRGDDARRAAARARGDGAAGAQPADPRPPGGWRPPTTDGTSTRAARCGGRCGTRASPSSARSGGPSRSSGGSSSCATSRARWSRTPARWCCSCRPRCATGRHVEAFTFGTRLTRLTPYLDGRDPERALDRAARAVPDWAGGTRIGEALHAFNDLYAPPRHDARRHRHHRLGRLGARRRRAPARARWPACAAARGRSSGSTR